ncbi:MAG: tape measure protein [Chitinophagaceae bacterium]|nr:tape measure protein [Nitrosomonas sp.]MCW5929872.1 tape measure protein [Chitinophagaceae bacterium]
MTETARLVIEADARKVSIAAAELEKLSRVGRDTEQSVNRFASATNSAFASIKNSVVGIVAAYASLETVKSFANAALDIQRFSNSLQVGLGSVQAANESMQFLRDSASELGLDLRSSAAQFSSLAAAAKGTALEGQATRDIFLGIAKASTALGLSTDQAGGALLAIQQIVSKGKVSLEELSGQLGERLPGALQIAARSMGMTTQELNKLVSTGNLTAEQLLPKLADELNRTFGTQAQAAAQGLQAQINRFNTALFDMQVAIGQTGLIDFLTRGIQLATQFFNTAAEGIRSLTASGDLERWGDNVSRIFAFILDSGRAVVTIFKAVGFGIATAAEQAASILTLNFSRAMELGSSFNQMMAQEFGSLTKNQDALNEQIRARRSLAGATEATVNAVSKEVQAVNTATSSITKATATRKSQVSESQRFLESLIKEASQLGKTSTEIKRLEAAKLGVLAAAKPFIERIEAENRALKDSEESMRNYQQMLSRAASITESVMNNEERFAQTQAELNRLLNSGAISIDTYNRALNQAEKQLQGVERTGRTAFDELGQFAIQAARNVQTAFADFFFDPFDKGLKGLVLSFANAVRRLIAEAAALKTIQGLGLGGVLGLSSTGAFASGGGGSALSLASLGSSAANLLSTGFGATSLIGGGLSALGGASTLGAFGAGLQGGSAGAAFIAAESATAGAGAAAGMGASLGAVAGPLIALAVVDQLGRFLAGNKTTGTFVDSIPVIGGFASALFGRGPLKQRGTTLSGTVGTEGFEEGSVQTDFRAKGGLFRSNKNDFARFDAVTGEIETDNRRLNEYAEDLARASRQIVGNINTTVAAVGDSLNQIGEGLGLSTEALNSFQTQIKLVSENGKFLEEAQIAEEIARISNEMALSLMPNVEDFSRMGESAVATLQRIGSEFDLLVNAATILGLSLAESREMIQGTAITDRTAFIDAAGGLEALSQQASFFADNFLTDAERLAPSIELLRQEMGELGFSADITKEQFRDLVQSFGQAGGISEDAFRSLLKLAPLFVRVKDGVEGMNSALSNTLELTERISTARNALITVYNRERSALQETASKFRELSFTLQDASDSLSLSSLSPLTPEQRLDEARTQFNRDRLAANAGDQEALRRLPESGKAFLEASRVFNASSAEFTSDFNFVQGVLESAAKLADVEAGIAEQQLARLEDQISRLVDINESVTSVEDAIRELTEAVLQGGGNAAISDQAIRDFVNTPGRTVPEIVDAAVKYGVSDDQFSRATGTPLPDISRATGGASISDQQISDFFYANLNNPRVIYDTAKSYGLTLRRVAEAANYPYADIERWAKENKLPMFERGTDYVQKGGLAMLHPAEAVTPANHMREMAKEISELKQELAQLRREQNQQTQALINVNLEANKINANMIIAANKEAEKGAAWREQNKVNVR